MKDRIHSTPHILTSFEKRMKNRQLQPESGFSDLSGFLAQRELGFSGRSRTAAGRRYFGDAVSVAERERERMPGEDSLPSTLHSPSPSPSGTLSSLFGSSTSSSSSSPTSASSHDSPSNSRLSSLGSFSMQAILQMDLQNTEASSASTILNYPDEDQLHAHSQQRQPYSWSFRQKDILHYSSRRLPGSMMESSFDLSGIDKVFSSTWLSDNLVVVGTKCQNIYVIDVSTGKKVLVPNINPLVEDPGPASQCHGIHSVSLNPSRTLLAAAAGKPASTGPQEYAVIIYEMPSFQPIAVLLEHQEMIFSTVWIDDLTVVSGSRDHSVKTWRLEPAMKNGFCKFHGMERIQAYKSSASQVRHTAKVRDLIYGKDNSQIFTLSADGSVKIWDAFKTDVTATVPLTHKNETVCLALDPAKNLVSVGSQSNISLIDPRKGVIVHEFESLDNGLGVRSMTIHQGLLSIGGGMGRISFYDIRAQKYIKWVRNCPPPPKDDCDSLSSYNSDGEDASYSRRIPLREEKNQEFLIQNLVSGKGWLKKDRVYSSILVRGYVPNAVYTLLYDETYGRLFAAGGPLQLNLQGSYAALWA